MQKGHWRSCTFGTHSQQVISKYLGCLVEELLCRGAFIAKLLRTGTMSPAVCMQARCCDVSGLMMPSTCNPLIAPSPCPQFVHLDQGTGKLPWGSSLRIDHPPANRSASFVHRLGRSVTRRRRCGHYKHVMLQARSTHRTSANESWLARPARLRIQSWRGRTRPGQSKTRVQ